MKKLFFIASVGLLFSCSGECDALCSQLNKLQEYHDNLQKDIYNIVFSSDMDIILDKQNKIFDEAIEVKSKMKDLDCSCTIKGKQVTYL